MSRSNPSVNAPNPAVRWFEWNGETGLVRYYDKGAKQNVDVELPFTFLLLDELASVRGWHDPCQSGIYSNEVRDTTKDVLVVKSFKGGILAEGYYKAIKDRVNAQGGQYVANCYVAVKLETGLTLCSIRLKGTALGSWMEFRKTNRVALYDKAVRIIGFTEGKKGRITYRMPTFDLKDVSKETNAQAVGLDKALQVYLGSYLQRKTQDQADQTQPTDDEFDQSQNDDGDNEGSLDSPRPELTDDDIPFAWLLPLALPVLGSLSLFA